MPKIREAAMRVYAAIVMAGLAAMLGGCINQPAPTRQADRPQPIQPTNPTIPAAPTRPPPSLEDAQRTQGERVAAALSKKTGVAIEPVTGAAPTWWPLGAAAGPGNGRGQATTLEAAYQQAVRQARSSGIREISKAGYARLSTGDYVAWVQASDTNVAILGPSSPPPAVATPAASPQPPATAATPAATQPATPAPAAPTTAITEVPSWFTTSAKEVDGRVQVGASADAPTVREAPRMATESARAALAQAMGKDVQDIRMESTYVRKVGDQYRAYVLVSSPGTMKK